MIRRILLGALVCTACGCGVTAQGVVRNVLLPEQRTIQHRDPSQFKPAPIPANVPPRTVSDPRPETPEWHLSLDEAIRVALENAQVVRILAGTTATSSGQTIYDTAVTNTTIDQEQARFDLVVKQNNLFSRTNTPVGAFDPTDLTRSVITSTPTDAYRSEFGLNKTNVLGGQWGLKWTENPTRFQAGSTSALGSQLPGATFAGGSAFPLNPQNPSAVELTYTQPLLQGGGYLVNTAPIVIARLTTELSFFQYKDSVQELVRSVAEAYWNLVQARTVVWARKIQVQQSQEAYERDKARLKSGLADLKDVAQSRVTYNQFVASRIAAEADVLTREGALRNLLGLPPSDARNLVPVSPPTIRRLRPDWQALVRLAEQRRPDVIELKIILEADQVRLTQAENLALPQLDATALYRFNGLSGTMPNGDTLSTSPGQFTDWTLGINFSVPLGLRKGRAQVRQQKLLIAKDRANLQQGLHAALHELAATVRDLDSAYEQYLALKETREAARVNLLVQLELYRAQRAIYLNVLQALNDWGNAVSSEAQALLSYNVALAALERRSGTILETHGLVFVEERFRAAGPLGIFGHGRLYPEALVPVGEPHRYPGSGEASENSFDLRNPARRDTGGTQVLPLPMPTPVLPAPTPVLPETITATPRP
jgi:outer membrane protein TolC